MPLDTTRAAAMAPNCSDRRLQGWFSGRSTVTVAAARERIAGVPIIDPTDPPGPTPPDVIQPHAPLRGRIFEGEPSLGSFKQGKVHDCFLLATVAGILASPGGPALIRSLFAEVSESAGDVPGKVRVRLSRGGDAFEWVEISKSLLSGSNIDPRDGVPVSSMRAEGPLWVPLLEKAYAKLGGSYNKLQDGEASAAMKALLGQEGERIALDQAAIGGAEDVEGILAALFSTPTAILDLALTANPTGNHLLDSTAAAFRDIFGDERPAGSSARALMDTWIQWAQRPEVQAAWRQIEGRHPIRFEHLTGLFGLSFPPPVAAALLQGWLTTDTKNRLPGKRGTGVYTDTQLDLFNRIEAALAAGRPVVAGSRSAFRQSQPSQVTEAKDKGLITGHAYTILEVKKEPLPGGGERRWLLVTHPWGHFGRDYYVKSSGTVGARDNKGEGVFWMELSDLTKRFNYVTLAKSPLLTAADRPASSSSTVFHKALPTLTRTAPAKVDHSLSATFGRWFGFGTSAKK